MIKDRKRFGALARMLRAGVEADQQQDRATSRLVCAAFRAVLHELCCAAVYQGAMPHDVVNIVEEEVTQVLGSELEWLTVSPSEVRSMIRTELEVRHE